MLVIRFEDGAVGDSDSVKCWQPPENLQSLCIVHDQGPRLPNWSNGMSLDNLLPNLTELSLDCCTIVKCLPPLRHLPNLKSLCLSYMNELEYIEEEDSLFLPTFLEKLELYELPKMKGWWRKVIRNNDQPSSSTSHLLYSFPSLSSLLIQSCPELEFLPLCPSLGRLELESVNAKLIPQLLSTRDPPSSSSSSLSYLACLDVRRCNELTSLPAGSLTSLSSLIIQNCENLKDVVVPPSHLNNLELLHIQGCPELELWEEKKTGVVWASLPKLRALRVDKVPSLERLPNCLRNRQADGNLQITRLEYVSLNPSKGPVPIAGAEHPNSAPSVTSSSSSHDEQLTRMRRKWSSRVPQGDQFGKSSYSQDYSSGLQQESSGKKLFGMSLDGLGPAYRHAPDRLRIGECDNEFSYVFDNPLIQRGHNSTTSSMGTNPGDTPPCSPVIKPQTPVEHPRADAATGDLSSSPIQYGIYIDAQKAAHGDQIVKSRRSPPPLPPPPPSPSYFYHHHTPSYYNQEQQEVGDEKEVKGDGYSMCESAPTALQDLIIPSKEIESFSKGILLLMGENYEFEKDKLIQLLMAEGFIENEPMEINGTKYFEDFLSKGYILYSDSNSLYRANNEKVKSDLDMINYLRLESTSRKNAATAETLHVSVVWDGMNDAVLNTLSKCYRLRTLIFLGAYSGRPEKMLVDLFLRFKSLVVLDLSGTDIKELPSSTAKMINLRYLDLSWTSIEILPEAICHFEELQTLRLEGCSHLWRLPRDFKRLTKLRHLYLDVLGQLAVIPTGMGALVNLRTLSAFIVDTQEGCKITELQNLDNLTGEFCIARLEHVQSAVDARLASLSAKKNLKKLELRWSDSSLQEAEGDVIRNDVLENLRPHLDLEELHIQFYSGTSLPGWIADEAFQKLASVTLYKCEHLSVLPSMQKLPSLEYLRLFSLIRVTKMDFIDGGSAFPKLRTLVIENILSLKTWAEAVEGDFPCLVELTIKDCPNLPELPSLVYLSSMKRLEISRCPKVQFVPKKELSTLSEFLIVEDCPLIEESYSNQRDQFLEKMKHVPIWIAHDDDSKLLDDDGSELDDDDSELLDDEHWTYGSDNHTEETYQDD